MLDDVDASLAAFFTATVPSRPPVQFEASATKPRKPTLHLALHRMREEIDGVGADWEDRRDKEGRVVSRERPPRKFRLVYLVHAEADSVAARHSLIGATLRAMIDYDEVPKQYRTGDVDNELPMWLRPTEVPERAEAVLAIEVVVAVQPTPTTDIAPPATELDLTTARIDVPAGAPTVPASTGPAPVGPGDRKWTTYRVRETAIPRE